MVLSQAEELIYEDPIKDHEHLPLSGHPGLVAGAQRLVFGLDPKLTARIASVQTVSGTGANHLGARFLSDALAPKRVWISDPSWINHPEVWQNVNPNIGRRAYPYYAKDTQSVDFDGMVDTLRRDAAPGDIVILHGCAHNPTGLDLTEEQWKTVAKLCKEKGQGFASGNLEKDAWPIRHFVDGQCMEVAVAQSFSKNFGLYGERVGALHIVTQSAEVMSKVVGKLTRLQRAEITSPPAYGARIVARILGDARLMDQWQDDLDTMSGRMKQMRKRLYEELKKRDAPGSWDHILSEIGMFSMTGLSACQSAMYASSKPDVNETVLAEWSDADGHNCTLGSLTPCHKRDAGFTLKVTTDEQQRVWAWLILAVTVKTAGRERQRELALVIPPHSSFAVSSDELEISQINTPGLFSAVGDARLFDSGRVMRANFALARPGRVLMPKSTAKKITPASRTTSDLLRGLRSLSQAHSFSVYIKPSDYARQGLKLVCDRNSMAPPPASPFAIEHVLESRTAEVDWSLFGIEPGPLPDDPPSCAPPPYLGPTPPPGDCEPLTSLLSPPTTGPVHVPCDSENSVISETDFEQHSLPGKDGGASHAQKRPLSPNAEHLPPSTRQRLPSQPCSITAGTTTSDALTANLGEWVEAALATNFHVYEHPRLQTHLDSCAAHAVDANLDAFLDARAALSADFFYDPDGTGPAADEEPGRVAYVADMARLLRWALRKRWGADVENFDTFLFLGRCAREAAKTGDMCDGGNGGEESGVTGLWRDPYRFRKSLCVNCVLLSCVTRDCEP
ncbi:hypothetical protein SLS54_009857 [Diplodia seriata]